MADITRKDWARGYIPSQDRTNGDPRGLLRMDNLHLDEDNVLSLTRGSERINTTAFGGTVHTCYSKYVLTTKWYYAALSDGSVRRSSDNFTSETMVVNPGEGNLGRASFGSSLGCIFTFSGGQKGRKREYLKDGTLQTFNCTPETPTEAPVINAINQPVQWVFEDPWIGGDWSIVENEGLNLTVGTTYAQFDTADSGSGTPSVYKAVILNTSEIDTRVEGNSEYLQDDGFSIAVRIQDSALLNRVRIEFIADDIDETKNYYWKEWDNRSNSPFLMGKSAWTTLKCNRWEFIREGVDNDFNWSTIVGMKVIVESTSAMQGNAIADVRFTGGEEGKLHGLYDYIQVNVSNNGVYVAKSGMSPAKESVFVSKGYVTLDIQVPTDDESINEIWIFRRSSDYTKAEIIPEGSRPELDAYYFVAKLEQVGGVFPPSVEDKTSDLEALGDNLIYRTNFISLLEYPDDILGFIPEYNGRAIYLTFKEVLFSDLRDPGLIDNSATIKLSGDPTQKNLWIAKTHPSQFYIGATNEIYILRGKLQYLPDGSMNVHVDSLGIDTLPLAAQVDESKGILYFIAADGVKYINGSEIGDISGNLKLLFEGHTRYEMPGIKIYTYDTAVYPIAIAKGKLWISVPLVAGVEGGDARILFVYDIAKQYWTTVFNNPAYLFTEEDGGLLSGFGGYMRELDTGTLLDGAVGQRIFFETIADDNNQPRNRKDVFTFKITADSGNEPVRILIAKDGSDLFYEIGEQRFDGKSEKLVSIAETIGLGKSFAVRLRADSLSVFKLYHFSIEYDARPEQLTYIRIPNTNLGTPSRKRFVNFPFVIDTLDHECEFFPLIDNVVAGSSSLVQTASKLTHIHYFYPTTLTDPMQDEFVGTDIGGIICGFFEFYGVDFEEIVSEKLPIPVKSMLIPGSDY